MMMIRSPRKKWLSLLFAAIALAGTALMIGSSQAQARRQAAPKAQVMLFISTDCPVAMRQSPRIASIAKEFQEKGIAFKAYFPNDLETREGISTYALDRGFGFPVDIDLGGERAKSYKIDVVPTAVVVDPKGKVLYQGPIDDHKDPTLVKNHFLRDALNAISAGKPVAVKSAKPFGCYMMVEATPPAQGRVNYAEHVKTIVDRACVTCHRPQEVAPFSLVGYENARKWAPMIANVTKRKKMPPWKAVHGYGEFVDENRLTEVEIETLQRWHQAGAPRGDAKKEPATPKFSSSEWPQGEPDLILSPGKPFKIAADGPDLYRHFILKTNFTEPKFVKAMAVKPGNKAVVHHVIAYLDEKGNGARLESRTNDGQEGYSGFGGVGFVPDGSLGGWAPGTQPLSLPKGIAFELKPGATVVLQVHYHRTGKDEVDQTKIGLYFADEKVDKVLSLAWLANLRLNIPAGAKNHVASQTFNIPADVTLYGVMPHMHLLGKSMRADVEFPDGTKRPLIYVNEWDFNWQLNYSYLEPIKIPKNSKIHVTATYDNSSDNPNNPSDPPKPVRWGEETTDEMMLLVAAYTVDGGMRAQERMLGFGPPEAQGGSNSLRELLRNRTGGR